MLPTIFITRETEFVEEYTAIAREFLREKPRVVVSWGNLAKDLEKLEVSRYASYRIINMSDKPVSPPTKLGRVEIVSSSQTKPIDLLVNHLSLSVIHISGDCVYYYDSLQQKTTTLDNYFDVKKVDFLGNTTRAYKGYSCSYLVPEDKIRIFPEERMMIVRMGGHTIVANYVQHDFDFKFPVDNPRDPSNSIEENLMDSLSIRKKFYPCSYPFMRNVPSITTALTSLMLSKCPHLSNVKDKSLQSILANILGSIEKPDKAKVEEAYSFLIKSYLPPVKDQNSREIIEELRTIFNFLRPMSKVHAAIADLCNKPY